MSESLVEPQSTPGQLLRAARERAGLSVEVIADQLKMTVTKIRALEQDNYQPFPADTYLKGYLRNYARMVDFSESEVIDSYESFVAAHNQQSINSSLAEAAAESKANTKKKVLALLLLILLSILLSYYYFDHLTASANQANTATVTSSEGDIASAVHSELVNVKSASSNAVNSQLGDSEAGNSGAGKSESLENTGELIAKPVLLQTPLAAEEELTTGESVESITLVSAEATPIKPAESSQVGYIFSFTASCWLEVVDSRGKKIISQEYRTGERVALEGQGPFNVLLGNASAARLTHNGKPVTITPRKNKNTLRITLKQ